jgi:hypothetical protein
MGWGETELMHPVHLAAQRKRSHDMSYPLTPIFNELADSGRAFSTIKMSLTGFFQQNEVTNSFADPSDKDALCGKGAYRVSTVDGHLFKAAVWSVLTETYTRSYEFNTSPGSESVSVQQVITGDSTTGWAPSPTHSQTASYSIQGDPANGGGFDPYVWKEITLSTSADRAYIAGRLVDWQAESETFRFATDSSIHDTSYATESDDGHAEVNGGHYRISNSNPFSVTLPTPLASDDDLWGGNYFAHILVTRRMLSPVLYKEKYKTTTGTGGSKSAHSNAMGIYNEGYSQEVFSDLVVENIWKDDYGIFDDGASLLDGAPKISELSLYLGAIPYATGEGNGHEFVFVSRNGIRKRITLEVIEYGYDEAPPYDEIITVLSSVQIVTDPLTLRVAHTFEPLADPFTQSVRVSLVEELVDEDEDEWAEVGGEEVIGGDATDPAIKVLHYTRSRYGARWGFLERKPPYEDYYRTKTYTKDLGVDTSLDPDEDGGTPCGGLISGTFLFSTTQSYSATTGVLQDREVTDFEMTMDGTDWTVADPDHVDSHVFGTTAIDTATTLRKELVVYPREGRFFVSFDEPRVADGTSNAAFLFGKVISSEWVKVAVAVDGSQHLIDWREIPTANAGECVTIDGFRLSET